jgi:hypothetical protein
MKSTNTDVSIRVCSSARARACHAALASTETSIAAARRCAALAAMVFVALALNACAATAPNPNPPDAPAALRPPAGQVVFLEALATGVQIYQCLPKAEPPSAFEWRFRAPEANLADRSGRAIGKHYAGPTWESIDGSMVVGSLVASDPGPNVSAIPWLLLSKRATTNVGLMTQTKSVQRVQTVGGIAPSTPCGVANQSEFARIPYTATYYFYRAAT